MASSSALQAALRELLPRMNQLEGALQCLSLNQDSLSGLVGRLGVGIPFTFTQSFVLPWTETQAPQSSGPCAQVGTPSGTPVATNLATIQVSAVVNPSDPNADDAGEEDLTQLKGTNGTGRPRSGRTRLGKLIGGDPTEKDKKKHKKHRTPSRDQNFADAQAPKKSKSQKHKSKSSKKPKDSRLTDTGNGQEIGSNGVNDLYEQLGLAKKSNKKHKSKLVGGGGNNCGCPSSSSSSSCPSSSSSSEDDCITIKQKTCFKCCPPPSLNFTPDAIMIEVQSSPLQGTFQQCGSMLTHSFSRDVRSFILAALGRMNIDLTNSGVKNLAGLLNNLPSLPSGYFQGVIAGYPGNLMSFLDFKNNRIDIGAGAIGTTLNAPTSTDGTTGLPRRPNPRANAQALWGFTKGRFNINKFTVSVILDLKFLSEWLALRNS